MRPGPRSPRATSTRASVRAIAHIRCADEDETTHFKRSPALSAESLHIPPPPQPPPHTVPCAQSARWADEGEREGDLRDAGGERERRGERGTERAAAAAAAPPASPPRGHRDIGRAVGTSAGGGASARNRRCASASFGAQKIDAPSPPGGGADPSAESERLAAQDEKHQERGARLQGTVDVRVCKRTHGSTSIHAQHLPGPVEGMLGASPSEDPDDVEGGRKNGADVRGWIAQKCGWPHRARIGRETVPMAPFGADPPPILAHIRTLPGQMRPHFRAPPWDFGLDRLWRHPELCPPCIP